MEGFRPTGTEESKGTVEPVFIKVAENSFVGLPDLFGGTENDEEEPGVSLGDFVRVPFGRCSLVTVAPSDRTDGCSSGETTGECQVNTRGEKGVDETSSITCDTHVWAGVITGTIGPVGSILDVRHELPVANDFQDTRYTLEAVKEEFLAGRRPHLFLSLGRHRLITNNSDRGSAVV